MCARIDKAKAVFGKRVNRQMVDGWIGGLLWGVDGWRDRCMEAWIDE